MEVRFHLRVNLETPPPCSSRVRNVGSLTRKSPRCRAEFRSGSRGKQRQKAPLITEGFVELAADWRRYTQMTCLICVYPRQSAAQFQGLTEPRFCRLDSDRHSPGQSVSSRSSTRAARSTPLWNHKYRLCKSTSSQQQHETTPWLQPLSTFLAILARKSLSRSTCSRS